MKNILKKDEKILWEGKPQAKSYFANRLIAPFIGITILLFVFALPFIISLFIDEFVPRNIALIIVCLCGGVLLVSFIIAWLLTTTAYKNLHYAITNKRAIIQHGIFAYEYRSIDYTIMNDLSVKIGLINKLYNTGTVVLLNEREFFGGHDANGLGLDIHSSQKIDKTNSFIAIENPYEVFNKLKEVSQNIRTDMYYPNELRPEQNKGYKTHYKK